MLPAFSEALLFRAIEKAAEVTIALVERLFSWSIYFDDMLDSKVGSAGTGSQSLKHVSHPTHRAMYHSSTAFLCERDIQKPKSQELSLLCPREVFMQPSSAGASEATPVQGLWLSERETR